MKKRIAIFTLLLCLALLLTGCGPSMGTSSAPQPTADFAVIGADFTETTPGPEEPGTIGADFSTPAPTPAPTAAPETPAPTPASAPAPTPEPTPAPTEEPALDENGSYTTKEDVALYIHLYGKLPGNFITKDKARDLGWTGGGLEKYAPGKCIGGDRFGNYEGLLPKGKSYRECDVDTLGASSRGAKRIIYSDDGGIWYTDDHYESFTKLY